MATTDISQATITNLKGKVSDYSVSPKMPDEAGMQDETYWDNAKFSQWFAYYKTIPEYKTAISAFATWVMGKGWTADPEATVTLNHMTGWGEDTFLSILWNLLVMKKVEGDAFAEIIRDDETGELLNLKPLGTLRIVVDRNGIVKRYEGKTAIGETIKYKPNEILHLCNDRIANEIHGTSITESVEWVILARNEAMSDYRKVLHRNINPLKIFEVDTDDQIKIDGMITKYQNMTKDYEAMFIPMGNMKLTIPAVPIQDPTSWIKYLENFFYQALGVPKVILGGSEEFTEASSKIGYLTFEQIYTKEVEELKADLWNQLSVRIEINKPASLKNEMLQSEQKQPNQIGFQPNDTTINSGQDKI